jgi:hypothetical protein
MGKTHNRASEGDQVRVVLQHVKADQWEVHKDFVMNILIPAAEKIAPTEMANLRFLYPTEPNEDGTYTSIWLMDPVIEEGNYQILDILQKVYGDQQGEEYYKLWKEPLASPQVGYGVMQSAW